MLYISKTFENLDTVWHCVLLIPLLSNSLKEFIFLKCLIIQKFNYLNTGNQLFPIIGTVLNWRYYIKHCLVQTKTYLVFIYHSPYYPLLNSQVGEQYTQLLKCAPCSVRLSAVLQQHYCYKGTIHVSSVIWAIKKITLSLWSMSVQ